MPAVTNNNDTNSVDTPRESDPVRQVQNLVEKKIRNLEKRKTRLEQLEKESKKSGKELNDDQKKALEKHDQVIEILDFFRDLNKNIGTIFQESQKAAKAAAKKEEAERKRVESQRLKSALLYQDILVNLEGPAKADFLEGANGAVKLSQETLDSLDVLQKKVVVNRQTQVPISEQIQTSARTLLSLVNGREKETVQNLSYKDLKLSLDSINESGYFDVKPVVEQQPVESTETVGVQGLEQIPLDQTSQLQPQLAMPPVQFLQDSTIDPDPAIVSIQHIQTLTNGGDSIHIAQNAKPFEHHIPTQTFTNMQYQNYGGNRGGRGGNFVGRGPRNPNGIHQPRDKKQHYNGNSNKLANGS